MKLDPEESVLSHEDALALAVMGPGKWVPFRETVKGANGYDWTVMGHRWEPDGPGNKILTEVEFTEVPNGRS